MANTKSAMKRVRQIKRRTERNKGIRSKVKTLRSKAVEAAKAGRAEEAQTVLKDFSSAVDMAQKKNIVHRNKAANLKRRTAKAVKAGSAA